MTDALIGGGPVADSGQGAPRVMHIIARILAGSGGDENTIFTVNGLSKLRHQCMVVYGGQSEASHVALLNGVETALVPHLVREIDPWKDLCALSELMSLMWRWKPDIVHTHTAKAGVLGRTAAKLTGVPIIIHGLHGTTFHAGQSRLAYRQTVLVERLWGAITTAFVSVSNDLSELYITHGIGRRERYVTVRSGMNLEDFKVVSGWSDEQVRAKRVALGLPPDKPLVLMVARLEGRKRTDRFLRIIAQFSQTNPETAFAIAGDGPEREDLEALAGELGVADRVTFLGFRDDVPEVIAAASVVCLTSAWEGLPRVLVQTVAVGRMIVCYDVNGAHEVVNDGVNGYVVTPDDMDTFCARLAETATALPYRLDSPTIDADPIDRWDADTMVRETAELYAYLMANKRLTPEFHEVIRERYGTRIPALEGN